MTEGAVEDTFPESMLGSRSLLALGLLSLILVTACGRQEPLTTVQDLVSEFPWAEVWSETREVDFGSLRGRRHLTSGWSVDEWDHPRRSGFVWGIGEESMLEFDVSRPRDLVLKLRCLPAPGLEDQRVEVVLNSHHLDGFDLEDRLATHTVKVDGEWLLRGRNELGFRYLHHHPGDGGDDLEARPLAVAWYELGFESQGAVAAEQPRLLAEDHALFLPPGTGVEYYLRLPPASVLQVAGIEARGEFAGQLSVSMQEDGGGVEEQLGQLSRSSRSQRLQLGGERSRVVRLTLEAPLTDGGDPAGSGLVVESPTVAIPALDSSGGAAETRAQQAAGPSRRPNILLYVVDTLRVDHLGIYGYPRSVSPHIDAFGSDATVFDDAVAQSSWTRASMASIFTSLWPLQHATNRRGDVLAPEAVTLAELLKEAGYHTVAFAKNQNIFPTFGFSQGFDDFNAMWTKGKSQKINARVEKWLETYDGERPFFLYLHAVDPHAPYGPPEGFKYQFAKRSNDDLTLKRPPGPQIWEELDPRQQQRIRDHLVDLYDGEIAYNDSTIGDLLDLLRERSLYEDTLIIFVSDHGEEFQEHGNWQHGRNLFAENLQVPLIIRFPEMGHGVRVERRVQHIDLMPTLLDYLGLEAPEFVEGRSFVDWVTDPKGPASEAPRPVFSFLHLDGLPNVSVIEGDWKLVQNLSKGEIAWSNLFNRAEDPGETRDRLSERPILAAYLASLVARRRSETSRLTAGEAILDERMEEALKALGYIN